MDLPPARHRGARWPRSRRGRCARSRRAGPRDRPRGPWQRAVLVHRRRHSGARAREDRPLTRRGDRGGSWPGGARRTDRPSRQRTSRQCRGRRRRTVRVPGDRGRRSGLARQPCRDAVEFPIARHRWAGHRAGNRDRSLEPRVGTRGVQADGAGGRGGPAHRAAAFARRARPGRRRPVRDQRVRRRGVRRAPDGGDLPLS